MMARDARVNPKADLYYLRSCCGLLRQADVGGVSSEAVGLDQLRGVQFQQGPVDSLSMEW